MLALRTAIPSDLDSDASDDDVRRDTAAHTERDRDPSDIRERIEEKERRRGGRRRDGHSSLSRRNISDTDKLSEQMPNKERHVSI